MLPRYVVENPTPSSLNSLKRLSRVRLPRTAEIMEEAPCPGIWVVSWREAAIHQAYLGVKNVAQSYNRKLGKWQPFSVYCKSDECKEKVLCLSSLIWTGNL